MVSLVIFHSHNPSGRTMALGLTQPLTEMSTSNISLGVKAAGAYGWQPYHLHVPNVLKSRSLSLLESSGPVQACNGIGLTLPYLFSCRSQFDRSDSHSVNRTINLDAFWHVNKYVYNVYRQFPYVLH